MLCKSSNVFQFIKIGKRVKQIKLQEKSIFAQGLHTGTTFTVVIKIFLKFADAIVAGVLTIVTKLCSNNNEKGEGGQNFEE